MGLEVPNALLAEEKASGGATRYFSHAETSEAESPSR
jgi:hypothetical protein